MTEREKLLHAELEALRSKDGMVHASVVVEWARDHPSSILHTKFQWDVDKAAYQQWVETARRLIVVYIVKENGERKTISLVPDRMAGGGYRDRDTVLKSKDMRRQAVKDAYSEVMQWRERNRHLVPELTPIFAAIDRYSDGPKDKAGKTRQGRRGEARQGEAWRGGAG
jgi:hypothetical protein